MEKKIIEQITDWESVAKTILSLIEPSANQATVIALTGDLGTGKTTLVQNIARVLGVTEPVTSPTFTLMKRYELENQKFDVLLHMDAYRLESEVELSPLQFSSLLDQPNTLFCIEWAEKIKTSLPQNTIYFQLEIDSEKRHTIHTV